MNSKYIILLLLFGLTMLFSINIKAWLLPDEKNETISYTNFTLGDDNYSIVSINEKNIFLLKNGEIVNNSEEITNAIKNHYKNLYVPNESKINLLHEYIILYNQSRNDGTERWPQFEEDKCRQVLLLGKWKFGDKAPYCPQAPQVETDTLHCYDEGTCNVTTYVICSSYHKQGLVCDTKQAWDSLYSIVHDFTLASDETTRIVGELAELTENLTFGKVKNVTETILSKIPELRTYMGQIEGTLFRYPLGGPAECPNCYGICPALDLNGTYLDLLEDLSNELHEKALEYSKYKLTAEEINNETTLRINYKMGEELAEIYFANFTKVNKTANEVITEAEAVLEKISTTNLTKNLNQLKLTLNNLTESYENRDFVNFDEKIDLVKYYINKTNSTIPQAMAIYEKTYSEYKKALHLYYILDSKNLAPELQDEFDELKENLKELKEAFETVKGERAIIDLYDDFKNITEAEERIAQKQQEFVALSKFRGFTRRLNNGAYDFLKNSFVNENGSIAAIAGLFPIGFSLLTFVSIFSLGILVLIFTYPKKQRRGFARFMPYISLFIYLIGVLIFSGSLFFYLNETSNNADLEEFLINMHYKGDSVVIVVNTEGVSSITRDSMLECGTKVYEEFNSKNKTAKIYEFRGEKCRDMTTNETVSNDMCGDIHLGKSTISLYYSSTYEKPKIKAVFYQNAKFYGNKDYYDTCPLITLFG